MLFYDGSHRCFQNSDTTVFFAEVLPQLPRGMLIGIHDIYLPLDYPAEWVGRYYTEQYLLLAWLLADAGSNVRIELPSFYLGWKGEVAKSLAPVWDVLPAEVERTGNAFWFRLL